MPRPPTVLLLAGIACSTPEPDPPPVDFDELPAAQREAAVAKQAAARASAQPSDPDAALEHTRKAAMGMGKGLKQRLQAAMKAGGPAEAVHACQIQAPKVASDTQSRTAVRAGRSSLRLRNPKNADAPAWVQAWLTAQGERPAEGVSGLSEVVASGSDRVARVLLPLTVEPVCLTCHGAPEALDASVQKRLTELYPEDKATGYQAGDLRGALWAEYTLPSAGG